MSLQQVNKALRAVDAVIPGAICAGGALRDIVFEKPIKDIDIFVHTEMSADAFNAALPDGWRACLQHTAEEIERYRQSFGPRFKELWAMVHRRDIEFPLVQIIVLSKPYDIFELVEDFDWAFCQIAKTADMVAPYFTVAFDHDAQQNSATCVLKLDDPRLERAKERGYRLMAKYPDRRFLFPLQPKKALEDIFG